MDITDIRDAARTGRGHAAPSGTVDRRHHPRYDSHSLPAILHLDSRAIPVTVRNLSLSGACLESAPPELAPGDSMELEATLGAYGRIAATCDIVRITPTENGSVLGVRFIVMGQEDTNRLVFFLHSLEETETAVHGGW